MDNNVILSIKDLQVSFRNDTNTVIPVNGVSFDVKKGQTLALVGESGCGKSVTAHSVMQLLANNGAVTGGTITYRKKDGTEIELQKMKKFGKPMTKLRGAEIGMVFQDPLASLNPVYTIGDQIVEGLQLHEKISKKDAQKRAAEMLETLGIPNAEERLKDYPHQFSGGMKQRVMIAIAMICNPNLLIADEPTTALDVTIQAQILELMREVQQKFETSIILITHNMGIVADMADNLAVMYMGRIVEFGTGDQVFDNPKHPYTEALLKSVPVLGLGSDERLQSIGGSTPDINNMPKGCAFAPRCKYATLQCEQRPPEVVLPDGHRVCCWRYVEGDSHE